MPENDDLFNIDDVLKEASESLGQSLPDSGDEDYDYSPEELAERAKIAGQVTALKAEMMAAFDPTKRNPDKPCPMFDLMKAVRQNWLQFEKNAVLRCAELVQTGRSGDLLMGAMAVSTRAVINARGDLAGALFTMSDWAVSSSNMILDTYYLWQATTIHQESGCQCLAGTPFEHAGVWLG